jgi:integrase
VLHQAVYWQLIFSNPCDRVEPPKLERKEARYLDEDEAKLMFDFLDNQGNFQYAVMVKLLLFTGLRRGELCGLMWSDVDFRKGLLTVERSLLNTPERGVFIDSTKNFASRRVLKLPQVSLQLLEDYRTWQSDTLNQLNVTNENDFMFTALDGKPIHPNAFSKWFNAFVKRNNLPSVCVHSLRHPYVKPALKNFCEHFVNIAKHKTTAADWSLVHQAAVLVSA